MHVAPHTSPRAMTPTPVRSLVGRLARALERHRGYELGAAVQRFSRDLATLRDQDGVVDLVLDGLCVTLALSGIAFLYGYLAAAARRTERVPDRQFRRFVRRELRQRLLPAPLAR